MTLFYTMKVNTSDIISNNYYIKDNFDLLRKNGKIISLGDNQLLRFIRRINARCKIKYKKYNIKS